MHIYIFSDICSKMTDDISLVRGISAAASSSSRSLLSSDTLEVPALHGECWEGLDRMSIRSLFPVQKICADLITKRYENPQYSPFDCDLCVSAPTGSGKSLAYILPIINGLIGRRHPVLRALIVLPTRDLALQVAQVISSFTSTSKSNLKVHCFIGGQTSMAEERAQLNATSPDIAVATIGRLVDHLVIGSLDLSYLRWLVVDEADRMLSKSDLDKWSLILQSVPSSTHRLLFSATMTSNPMKLSKLHLTRPLFVSVGTGGLPKSILHKYIVVPNKSMKVRGLIKLLELTFEGGSPELLSPEPSNRCLILCRTAANVDSLSSLLASFYKNSSRVVPAAFSGNMSGKQREKLLSKFAKGSTNCLVSTDVITRGIDIPDIDTVINYDVPSHCTTYIHRAGRTGRANKKGLVVTLAQSNEMRHFRREVLARDASIKNAMARFPLDFSGLMTHDELEGIVEADSDLLDE